MNENLNLVEILKDRPKGTKLYSTVFGEVKFMGIKENAPYPIIVKVNNENFESFTADGRIIVYFDGECTLFPSKDQRDWSKFKLKKPKFDPMTLKPFDRVLVKQEDYIDCTWSASLFSHLHTIHDNVTNIDYLEAVTTRCTSSFCIPYNDETKHLVGTKEEAPEYYRYWED